MIGQGLVQLARGNKVTPSELTGITATATSGNQRSNGHNAVILSIAFTAGSGTFTVKIQGKFPKSTSTYIDMYDNAGNLMQLNGVTADRMQLFVGIPDDFRIVATEDADGATVSVAYELITV